MGVQHGLPQGGLRMPRWKLVDWMLWATNTALLAMLVWVVWTEPHSIGECIDAAWRWLR